MIPSITPLYAALLAIVFLYLSFRTIHLRRKNQITIGDGSNPLLQRAIRAHTNFTEYVPLALILLSYIEMLFFPPAWIHVLATALLVGRIIHAYGISQVKEKLAYRIMGMMLTMTMLGITSTLILLRFLKIM